MPPDAEIVTVEVPPKQEIALALAVAVTAVGCDIVPVVVAVHPLASVTV